MMYICSPIPKDTKVIWLRVIKDIERKKVRCDRLPELIEQGSITWALREHPDSIFIENPRYEVKIPREYFEIIDNMDEILLEAIHKYPIGTKYIPLDVRGNDSLIKYTSTIEPAYFENTKNIECGIGYIYANGKWAEIIKDEKEIIPTQGEINTKFKVEDWVIGWFNNKTKQKYHEVAWQIGEIHDSRVVRVKGNITHATEIKNIRFATNEEIKKSIANKLEIGKWYRFNAFGKTNVIKCSNYTNAGIITAAPWIILTGITFQLIGSGSCSIKDITNIKELSIDAVQQYLPNYHPDKINLNKILSYPATPDECYKSKITEIKPLTVKLYKTKSKLKQN